MSNFPNLLIDNDTFQPNYHYSGFITNTPTFGSNGAPFLRYSGPTCDFPAVTTNMAFSNPGNQIFDVVPQIQRKFRLQSLSDFYGSDSKCLNRISLTKHYTKFNNLSPGIFRPRKTEKLLNTEVPILIPTDTEISTEKNIYKYICHDGADILFRECFSPFIQDFFEPSNFLETERWENLMAIGKDFLWVSPIDSGKIVVSSNTKREPLISFNTTGRLLSIKAITPCGTIVLTRYETKINILRLCQKKKQLTVELIKEIFIKDLCDCSCLFTTKHTKEITLATTTWKGEITVFDIYKNKDGNVKWLAKKRVSFMLSPEERTYFSSSAKIVVGDITLNTPPCLCTFCDAYMDKLYVLFGCTLRCINISHENIDEINGKLITQLSLYTSDPKRNTSFIDPGSFQTINVLGRGISPHSIIGIDKDYLIVWDVRDPLLPALKIQHNINGVTPFSYIVIPVTVEKRTGEKLCLNEILINNGYEVMAITLCSNPVRLYGVSMAQPYLIDWVVPERQYGIYDDFIIGVAVSNENDITENKKGENCFKVDLMFSSTGFELKTFKVIIGEIDNETITKKANKLKETHKELETNKAEKIKDYEYNIDNEIENLQAERLHAFYSEWEEFRENCYNNPEYKKKYSYFEQEMTKLNEAYYNNYLLSYPKYIMETILPELNPKKFYEDEENENKIYHRNPPYEFTYGRGWFEQIQQFSRISVDMLKKILNNAVYFTNELYNLKEGSEYSVPGSIVKYYSKVTQAINKRISPLILKEVFCIGLNKIEKIIYSSLYHDQNLQDKQKLLERFKQLNNILKRRVERVKEKGKKN